MANEIIGMRNKIAAVKRKMQTMVERAVRKLRERGFSYIEIADILGLKESIVRCVEKEREEYEEHQKKIGG